ncbi:PR domain zinc finger protein 2 [Callorhinchus milii]|uniref:PR domain zinc finger protein 2 n=1 Tax=Callorhinchus milii TaxID=7868 RepID=V9K7E9_CALMI|nr:PR domain zinc finger protein 2 [Callorhinchus milii]XP_042199500.1 PR domain zinc finger protein 2 [Callorhinchus milii]XP_042199501.1 PR domain zinc finger protein 2 [Callorhinchus milii]XP_042199502.1 PR domain zinc finger protein 2 [Callorhinchus milii]XP_042199503.1 PR domain zinc finger protein 2 [Callorhinchus milii]XP_042199504.1 PR domain zinc finger protein 2 [Callorhinchus milii]|eukprot:gi/632959988/ref/XP_007895940.1/ PREDICTED: PR domain zinc finger protein 2 [Callorhinchus milii]
MPEEKSSAENCPKKKLPIKTLKHRSKGDQNGTRDFEETHMFPCKNCERRFTTKQGLERHQHIHISTEGFTFKCKYCGKAFGTHINMRRHERRHEAAPKKKNIVKGSPALQIPNEDFEFDQRAIDISVNNSMRLERPVTLEDGKISVAKDSNLEPSSARACEPKLQHPCRLCKKTFGSYTNLRRHQRRIHERPLLAKGIRVRRKGLGDESNLVSEQSLASAGNRTTRTEMEEEEEVEEEEEESDESQAYIMDVSSNISENLNFYIDGKIESNSNTSNCEVIELDTTCTNPYGLASVLYAVTDESPQNLKITAQVAANHSHLKEPSDRELKGPKRRRTISPLPFGKAKPDLGVETISSAVSSLCPLPLPAQTTNALTGPLEKNTFLTSKLKQLLQIQDGNTPRAVSGESLAIVTPSTSTGAAMGFSRFKRRTSSPPNSPQHSPALSGTGKDAEFIRLWSESLPGLKVPKIESQNSSPAWSLSSREEALSPLSVDNAGKITGSKECQTSQLVINLCSQQPLDLSSGKVQTDVKTESSGSGVAILDLSLHKKPCSEGDVKEETGIAGPHVMCGKKKRKPTTSMLEKVLLNEYNGTDLSVADRQEPEGSPKACLGAEAPLQATSESAPAEPFITSPVPSPLPPVLSVPSPLPQSSTSVLQAVTPALSPVSVHIKEEIRDSDYPDSDSEQEASHALPPTIEPEIPQESPAEYCPEEQEGAEEDCQTSPGDHEKTELAFTKNFTCNVCEMPFLSIKDLAQHLHVHAEHWPFKCEFCVQLFKEADCLSEHRSSLHGVGKIFACSVCNKEFAFLCNLQHHQRDLHPGKECTHQELENGMLRPQNFTDPNKATSCPSQSTAQPESSIPPPQEEDDDNSTDLTEELYTTIKVMASGVKSKGPDVRMGLNQRYPSFKPPPFQYHNRNTPSNGSSAVNFTTHNIPQTFSTAIHCTKCGKSFDNMPALHKHILACASASDKRRYTPKKNAIPLKKKVWKKNGALGGEPARNSIMRRMGQPKRLSFDTDSKPKATINKLKMNALKRKRNRLVQKAIAQKKRASAKKKAMLNTRGMESHHCPYCVKEFTYLGSLNKHVTYSCPKKPVSPSAKGSGSHSPASSEKGAVQRRRTADTEIKLQSTPILLGKRRGRMLGTLQTESVSSAPRLQQRIRSLPPIKSKKPNNSSVTSRTTSPVRSAKGSVAESKRFKSDARQRTSATSTGMASPRLYLRMKNKKVVWQRKANVLKQKRPERYSGRSKETRTGAITRSGGPANTDSEMEDDQENQDSSSEDVQVSLVKMVR